MASGTYYMVHIERLPSVTFDEVKGRMDKALDWFRLSESLWIVYSTVDVEKLYARLNPLAISEGTLLLVKLDMSVRQGWMEQTFWDWLDKRAKADSSD